MTAKIRHHLSLYDHDYFYQNLNNVDLYCFFLIGFNHRIHVLKLSYKQAKRLSPTLNPSRGEGLNGNGRAGLHIQVCVIQHRDRFKAFSISHAAHRLKKPVWLFANSKYSYFLQNIYANFSVSENHTSSRTNEGYST